VPFTKYRIIIIIILFFKGFYCLPKREGLKIDFYRQHTHLIRHPLFRENHDPEYLRALARLRIIWNAQCHISRYWRTFASGRI